jgi:hypothetical protein
MSLAAWFPGPTLVRIGSHIVAVWQLRPRDLGVLEAYVGAKLGGPLNGLDPASPSYGDDLRAAYDMVEASGWPPPPGSDDWNMAIEGDAHGLAFFLAVVLRDNPSRVDVDQLAAEITAEEWTAVTTAAWGITAQSHRAAIVRAIDRHLGLPAFAAREWGEEGKAISWAKAVGEVVCGGEGGFGGMGWASPEAVGDLTLSQLRMVRDGGETEEAEDPMPDDDAMSKQVEAARLAFFWPEGLEIAV